MTNFCVMNLAPGRIALGNSPGGGEIHACSSGSLVHRRRRVLADLVRLMRHEPSEPERIPWRELSAGKLGVVFRRQFRSTFAATARIADMRQEPLQVCSTLR